MKYVKKNVPWLLDFSHIEKTHGFFFQKNDILQTRNGLAGRQRWAVGLFVGPGETVSEQGNFVGCI